MNLAELHPGIVHFAVAAPSIAILLSLPALLTGKWNAMENAARVMVLGAFFGIAATFSGEQAHDEVKESPRHSHELHEAIEEHEEMGEMTRNLAIVNGILAFALLRRKKWNLPSAAVFLLATTVNAGMASFAGYLGGELVYTHGAGVKLNNQPSAAPVVRSTGGMDHSGHGDMNHESMDQNTMDHDNHQEALTASVSVTEMGETHNHDPQEHHH